MAIDPQAPLQEQQQTSLKASVDIIFVIDASGSMTPCIEGVKRHMQQFVVELESNDSMTIDWRVAGLIADNEQFDIIDFQDSAADFSDKIAMVGSSSGWDEFTLPAIDWAADFKWRSGVNKVMLVFTDEPIEGGMDPDRQVSKLDVLLKKLVDLKVMLFIIGPECPIFTEMSLLPNSNYTILEDQSFETYDFQDAMQKFGKTVSNTVISGAQDDGRPTKDLYGLARSGEITMNHL